MKPPLLIELFCGLHGWAAGALAEGWRVVGFDLYDMCKEIGYPKPEGDVQLVLQDVRTLHGSQFKNADLIVSSSPCTRYSYMAMPFSRGKAQAAEIRADTTGAKLLELNELFDAQFRIQREACEAAGRYIPMVVENVKGAQPWVGRAINYYGPYALWGDVPALISLPMETRKGAGSGRTWFHQNGGNARSASSKSLERKSWSAQVARIPLPLSQYIARVYKPRTAQEAAHDS